MDVWAESMLLFLTTSTFRIFVLLRYWEFTVPYVNLDAAAVT